VRQELSVRGRSAPGHTRGRVVIISCSLGAGHDAAAKAIAARLNEAGYAAEITDIVKLISKPLGRSLRAAYLQQVQLAPSVYRYLLRYGNRSEGINKVIIKTMRGTPAMRWPTSPIRILRRSSPRTRSPARRSVSCAPRMTSASRWPPT
jgi:hypothetical protein